MVKSGDDLRDPLLAVLSKPMPQSILESKAFHIVEIWFDDDFLFGAGKHSMINKAQAYFRGILNQVGPGQIQPKIGSDFVFSLLLSDLAWLDPTFW